MPRRAQTLQAATAWVLAVVLCLTALPTLAQSDTDDSPRSADAYFHDAAQQYIAENIAEARRLVEAGLDAHPSDARLTALQDKLERTQPRSSSDSSAQNQGGRSSESGSQGPKTKDDAQEGTDEGEEGSKSRDSSTDPSSRPQGQRPGPDAPPSSQQRSQSGDPGAAAPPRGDGSAGKGGQQRRSLSRAQAERILRALQGQEEQLLREVQKRSARPTPVEKDW